MGHGIREDSELCNLSTTPGSQLGQPSIFNKNYCNIKAMAGESGKTALDRGRANDVWGPSTELVDTPPVTRSYLNQMGRD